MQLNACITAQPTHSFRANPVQVCSMKKNIDVVPSAQITTGKGFIDRKHDKERTTECESG
jgi:hypothetical protein